MHIGYYTRFVDRDTMRPFLISKETLQLPKFKTGTQHPCLYKCYPLFKNIYSGFIHWLNSFIESSLAFSYGNVCCNITFKPDRSQLNNWDNNN